MKLSNEKEEEQKSGEQTKKKKRIRFELVRVNDPLLSRIDFRPIARNNENKNENKNFQKKEEVIITIANKYFYFFQSLLRINFFFE